MASKSPRKISKKFRDFAKYSMQVNNELTPRYNFNIKTKAFTRNKISSTESKKKISNQSREILYDYLECSSVHGVKYFGNISIRLNRWAKFLWTLTMCAGVICSSLMVLQFWNRFRANPTMTYVKTFFAPLPFIPFPAVTICPLLPLTIERRQNITDSLKVPPNMTRDDVLFLIKHIFEISTPWVAEEYVELKNQLADVLNENNLILHEFKDKSMSCEDIFEACYWNGEKKSCSKQFSVSHSTKGICCSFNYILENEILKNITLNPVHSTTYGPPSGLKVIVKESVLRDDNEMDSLTRLLTNSPGALVVAHNSDDYPGDGLPYRILQPNREVQLGITPTLEKLPKDMKHTTDDGEIEPLCYPKDQKVLKHFPSYRYKNCFNDCILTLIIQTCGCVPFSYSPMVGTTNIEICGFSHFRCLKDNGDKFDIIQDTKDENLKCTCQSSCDDVVYDTTSVITKLNASTFEHSPSYRNLKSGSAVLRVFMTSQVFTIHETISATQEVTLLASLGGVFSLFLGCSFLSAFEIIYFGILFCRKISSRFNPELNIQTQTKVYDIHANTKVIY